MTCVHTTHSCLLAGLHCICELCRCPVYCAPFPLPLPLPSPPILCRPWSNRSTCPHPPSCRTCMLTLPLRSLRCTRQTQQSAPWNKVRMYMCIHTHVHTCTHVCSVNLYLYRCCLCLIHIIQITPSCRETLPMLRRYVHTHVPPM